MLSAFPKNFKIPPTRLSDATISDFSGGLDVIDNDLTMKSKYAKVLTNWVQGTDGSLSLRWGEKFKYDVTGAVAGDIIEIVYFASHLVVFMDSGEVASITEAGVIAAIWNSAIAALLPGAPSGWSGSLDLIDTTEFKGQMVVCNGVDKPLLVKEDLTTEYLNDPASGSNVNTPIGKFCTTVANYVVIGGISALPGTVYISSQGTSGVFPGDAAPNDSLSLDLSTNVPQNSKEVIGLASFRNNLFVQFEGAVVIVELGIYDTNTPPVHVPKVQDDIVEHGVINHRTMIVTKNDLIMADTSGWHTANKNSFGLVNTVSFSDLIDPDFQSSCSIDTDKRKLAFSVWNRLENRVTTFVTDDDGNQVGWTASYQRNGSVQRSAWSRVTGMTFTCGCNSQRGRIFFGKGTKVYQYGNSVFADEEYTADLIADVDSAWVTLTNYSVGDKVSHGGLYYKCLVIHTSNDFDADLDDNFWEEYTGEPIDFDWELPWTDINKRANKKRISYIQADTQGSATFTISFFCDNYYKDADSNYDPAIEMDFVAGDSGGYGNRDQPYGGGRRLRDERPWGTPVDFKILKIRVHGSTKLPLKFVALTILYILGGYRRA